MTLSLSKKSLIHIFLCDICVALVIVAAPVLAHISSLPLYYLEPMRIAVIATIFLTPSNKWNAVIMALGLPILSYCLTGHPIFPKNMIMSLELALNVLFFYIFLSKIRLYSLSLFISILISKCVYYSIKYFLLLYGLVQTIFVSTNIMIQVIIMTILSLLFIRFDLKQKNHE